MSRLQLKCPVCGLPQDEKSSTLLPSPINLKVINLLCGHSYTEVIQPLKDWEKIETYDTFGGKRHKLFQYQGEGYEFALKSNFRTLIGDEPGLGKGQILTDKILTPTGWKLFGDIQLHDNIVGMDGNIYQITGVFDRGILPTYKVTMNDGSFVTVDSEHLWLINTSTRISRGVPPKVRHTKGLIGTLIDSSGKCKYHIPIASPTNFIGKPLTIDPYIQGVLLGDGCFADKNRVMISSIDEEILNEIDRQYSIRHLSNYDYALKEIIKQIRELGLSGTKSNSKFVPECYKFTSYDNRLAILQGLMDTDGSIWNNGVIEYTTVSERLCDDVKFLVQSLGGTVRISTKIPTYTYKGEKKNGQLAYRVILNIPVNPFRLLRKSMEWKPRTKYAPARAIKSIEYVGEQEIRCISVSAPDKLYVTNDFIVTHNTFQAYACIRLHPDILTPALVVCKSALKIQQLRAALQMLGPEFIPEIISSSKDRPSGLFKITIVTYDLLGRITKGLNKAREDKEKEIRKELNLTEWDIIPENRQHELPEVVNPFTSYGYQLVILDECQQIKNQSSKRAQEVRSICASVPHVIATSGSPIENNAGEYFTILNILKPERFRNYKDYLRNYCDYYDGPYGPKVGGIRDLDWFKKQTSDFIIRRKMKDVQADLPKLYRKFISCEFATDKLKREYEDIQQEFVKYFRENEGSKDFSEGILKRINIMRHKTGISKVPFAVEYITDLMNDTQDKVVVFTHHLDVAQVLNIRLIKELEEMRSSGSSIRNPLMYTADLSSEKRDEVVTDFINDPNARIFLASTIAAGEGLDGLQKTAQHCIVLERQWNPKKEEQAEKRLQRIGAIGTGEEDSRIDADYIMVAGTIDEYFAELVEIKRANVNQTLDYEESNYQESSLIKELAAILAQKGSQKWKLK